jgi:heme/copper-type cytochrome/quinol oxidase subunit 3
MTAATRTPDDRLLPPAAIPTQEIAVWGMALFCATEAALFAYLLTSYFYLGVTNPRWPPAGVEDPKLTLPLIMTGLLLASSVAAWWGERCIKQGRAAQLRLGLGLAMLLGLGFLACQMVEYREKLKHMLPQTHAYAATFYTITGFHGMHVALGVLFLGYTLLRALREQFSAIEHTGVTVTSLYWHTVDGIWLAILASLYLSPRFA